MALGKGRLMLTLLSLHHWRNLLISFKYVAAVDVDLDLIIVVSKLLKSGFIIGQLADISRKSLNI